MESLDSFLEDKNSVGIHQSEGQFTVDVRRRLEKLEAFRLADQGGYLLKALQVACCLDTSLVLISIGTRTVKVEFGFFYQDSINAELVAEGLTGQNEWSSPVARHLGLCMRAALGTGHHTANWHLGPEHLLRLSPEGAECRSRPEENIVHATLEFTRTGSSANQRAMEHDTLYRRARYFPTEVRVDTRPVERGWERWVPSEPWYFLVSLPYDLMEQFEAPEEHLPSFLFPQVDLRLSKRLRDGTFRGRVFKAWASCYKKRPLAAGPVPTLFHRFHQPPGSARKTRPFDFVCGAAFRLPLHFSGSSSVSFVLDGVVSTSVDLGLEAPGLRCIASGEGLRTDLSEFGIMEDDVLAARLRALREAARRFVDQVAARRGEFMPFDDGELQVRPDHRSFQANIDRRFLDKVPLDPHQVSEDESSEGG